MSTYKSQVSLELPSEILRKRISSLICALRFGWYAVCGARPPPLAYFVSVVTLVLVSVLPSANVKVVSTFVVVVVVFSFNSRNSITVVAMKTKLGTHIEIGDL